MYQIIFPLFSQCFLVVPRFLLSQTLQCLDLPHRLSGLLAMDILTFVQSVQHMDMVENVGKTPNTKVLFIDKDRHQKSLRDDVIEAEETVEARPSMDHLSRETHPFQEHFSRKNYIANVCDLNLENFQTTNKYVT